MLHPDPAIHVLVEVGPVQLLPCDVVGEAHHVHLAHSVSDDAGALVGEPSPAPPDRRRRRRPSDRRSPWHCRTGRRSRCNRSGHRRSGCAATAQSGSGTRRDRRCRPTRGQCAMPVRSAGCRESPFPTTVAQNGGSALYGRPRDYASGAARRDESRRAISPGSSPRSASGPSQGTSEVRQRLVARENSAGAVGDLYAGRRFGRAWQEEENDPVVDGVVHRVAVGEGEDDPATRSPIRCRSPSHQRRSPEPRGSPRG